MVDSISSDSSCNSLSDMPFRGLSRATVSARSFNKAAKGHRNLFFRGTTTLLNAMVTAFLIFNEIDIMHQPSLLVCQLVGSASLYIQWRNGRPAMFILRGCASFGQAIVSSHSVICGRRWYFWDECVEEAWTDARRFLRFLGALSFFRLICNGISLLCQYRYPHRMFRGRGNEQLFYRGCIQAIGVPISLTRFILKLVIQSSISRDQLLIELVCNLIRACVLTPLASFTLFNQWWLTKKGATGHATSDAYERLMDPTIDCPLQRVRVTILSASSLRNADICGISDPFVICEVLGRPESTWKTNVVHNSLDPVWNESCELKAYRLHDTLKFSVLDFDSHANCCNRGHDPLGDATLRSERFHPNGFDGGLMIEGTGKGKKVSTLRVRVDLLDAGDKAIVLGIQGEAEELSTLAAEDTDRLCHDATVGPDKSGIAAPSKVQIDSFDHSLDENSREMLNTALNELKPQHGQFDERVTAVIDGQLADRIDAKGTNAIGSQNDECSFLLAPDLMSREGLVVPRLTMMQPSANLRPSMYFTLKRI